MLAAIAYDPVTADGLGERLGWNAQRISAALLELELAGHLSPVGHGTFQRLGDPGSNFAGESGAAAVAPVQSADGSAIPR